MAACQLACHSQMPYQVEARGSAYCGPGAQYSLSMAESWRKVIPVLSMIKLTPHGVSQIRFCALDTVVAAYSTLSRTQSHLSC